MAAPHSGWCKPALFVIASVMAVALLPCWRQVASAAGSLQSSRDGGTFRLRAGGFGADGRVRVHRVRPASAAKSMPGPAAKFYPEKCRELCSTPEDFIEELVPPTPDIGNRATQWTDLAVLQIPTAAKAGKPFSPPMAARYLAVVSMCFHDALTVAGAPWVPIYNRPKEPSEETDFDAVISGAAYEAMQTFFPWDSGKQITETFLAATGDRERSPEQFELGRKACKIVITTRSKDGSNMLGSENCFKPGPYCDYTNYAPRNPAPTVPAKASCDQIKYIDSWQPLCLMPLDPKQQSGCKVQSLGGATMPMTKTYTVEPSRFYPLNGVPMFDTASESKLLEEIWQVVNISANLGDFEKLVAEYWADGPDEAMPPGHWAHIASTAAVQEDLDLFQSVQLMFAVSTAMLDSAVTAWSLKRIFDSARPLQYVQCGLGSTTPTVSAWQGPYLGAGNISTASWRPYQQLSLLTPPFSGYISGHSTFSRAVAEVMDSFFGDDQYKGGRCLLVPEGKSVLEPKIAARQRGHVEGRTDVPNSGAGTPGYVPAVDSVLCWETFKEAAQQAGISRLYGGIHIMTDNKDGLNVGRRVGRTVWRQAMRQWNDEAPLKGVSKPPSSDDGDEEEEPVEAGHHASSRPTLRSRVRITST